MKIKIINSYILITLMLLSLVFSCRTEDDLSIDPPAEETIAPNSTIANLMGRVATHDGSSDNILDFNSRISIQLPVTVTINGIDIEIVDENGYQEIEDILDFLNLDFDAIIISYPITVIFPNYTTAVVNSDLELQALNMGGGDNEDDDDIECIDFQYPIVISYFDEITELASTITLNNDNQLYNFIDDLEDYAAVSINFPIVVILADGTTETINNIQDLEIIIETADDSCDEDDDNDFDDDDCDSCSTSDIDTLFAECTEWIVDDLERNDNDLEDNYTGYTFTFAPDGTISVVEGINTFNGTWQTTGDGNDIVLIINITGLDDFNGNWDVDEYEQDSDDAEIELSIGEDSLSFESECTNEGSIDDEELVDALTDGDWYITYFFDDTNETTTYTDYVFNFALDNSATATDTGGTTNGSWSTAAGDSTELSLILNFGTSAPLDELTEDWDVLEVTDDIIRLKHVSGGNGTEDFITFERTPFDGGGSIVDDLGDILIDGLWYVASYTEGTVDQSSSYNGYLLNFSFLGTVVATNGLLTNAGTWSVNTSENQLNLNFGIAIPFNIFNNGAWDVISVSETEVVIQDSSGSTTNTLTIQKL